MRNINQLIVERLAREKSLRPIHLKDALETLMEGDTRAGLIMIRNLVNAMGGFSDLAAYLNKSPKSVMRMLSPDGNPTTENIFLIIHYLLGQIGADIKIQRKRAVCG